MKTTTSNPTAKNPFRAGSFSYAALITLTAFAIAGTAQTSANDYNVDWRDRRRLERCRQLGYRYTGEFQPQPDFQRNNQHSYQ